MLCISLESTDPFFNLAIEEILLKNRKEEFLILGINNPSLIIGKHQVAHREVNTKYVTENKIPVIRRITGGGTVFHDFGNLNFTFISESETGRQVDFRKYTRPVIDFLLSAGVEAKFEGKNDLKINGLKISGNAEHIYRNRVLHHGTLLFSTSLNILRDSIRKDYSKYTSRAVASNPSPVINLEEILTSLKDADALRNEMMNYFLKMIPDTRLYTLTQEEKLGAEALAGSKYRTWDWNYAYGPEYWFNNQFDFRGEKVLCKLNVKEGRIKECSIEGQADINAATKDLIGCRHMADDMTDVFQKHGIHLPDIDIFNFF